MRGEVSESWVIEAVQEGPVQVERPEMPDERKVDWLRELFY